MKKTFTVLIAARMGSSRFRGKTLANICGVPMLERLINRIKMSKYIDQIVVATAIESVDDILQSWCERNNIRCFRGSECNVLGRLLDAANKYNANHIVEVLGDNPLVHSDIIDSCVELYLKGNYDYVATLTNEYQKVDKSLKRFPVGVRAQVFNLNVLKKCSQIARNDFDREHPSTLISSNPDLFKTGFITAVNEYANCNKPNITFAVNKPNNLIFIEKIFSTCLKNNKNFSVAEAIHVLEENPDWFKLMGNDA
tara:strand:- start:60 stop:821 length:762 start_codon:yes stop_codon:yes gene_type:complete